MKHFAIMIALLAGFAVVLIIIGTFVWASLPKESNNLEVQRAGDRITPVAAVYAGDTGRAAMEAAKAAGQGAAVYKGRLVDIASIKQAEVIVRQAEMIAG